MTANPKLTTERKLPTRTESIVFRAKTLLLQTRRVFSDRFGSRIVRHRTGSGLASHNIIATSRTLLWTENDPHERFLVAGKIHNLRIAIRNLDGLEVPAGETFSFWKQIGRASKVRGFVAGRELREGCIIPNVGGGLCQLSNALYDAALQANCEIVERHAHTQVIAGSLAEKGRDATVFWNYVDLRFRSDKPFRIETVLDSKDLTIRFRGTANGARSVHQIQRAAIHTPNPNSCATCEVGDCHRVLNATPHADFGRTAYIVDEFATEFDRYIQLERTGRDLMLMPLDGRRFRKANYAWSTNGFGETRQSLWVTAKRSYRSRKLAAQGAARQLNLLRMYEELAESYSKHLTYDVTHVVVQQSLLPFLWQAGHLGGRSFDVLMSALPMHDIQKRLDLAFQLHPESGTLGDFRANTGLLDAEREALAAARKIVTAHSEIARLFPDRAERIDWEMPAAAVRADRTSGEKHVIVFPATTVGRKGCYELRDALRDLDVKLIVLGPMIEGADFWKGFDVERGSSDWLGRADVVVLPAHVEHRPRRLIAAARAGIPVIATRACGVDGVENVTTVEAGDVSNLRHAILENLAIK